MPSRSRSASQPTTTCATSSATAIDDLRSAADRLQGRKSQSKSHTGLLVAGIALGILFNPVTGPETRRWLKDMLSGGGDDFGDDFPSSNGGVEPGCRRRRNQVRRSDINSVPGFARQPSWP